MSGKRSRKSYTSDMKLRVVAKAEEVGNREAGRIFEVDEKSVRQWRSKKNELEKMDRNKRANRRRMPAWPLLEENLMKWFTAERQSGIPISTVKIRLKARCMAERMGLNNFKGGPTWCYRFMRRNKLSIRSKTTTGQALPTDWEEKRKCFLDFTENVIKEGNFNPGQIFNMDEVPLTFDCPPNRTVDHCGKKSICIETTGNEKTHFTVVLSCGADGTKLKPCIIFKRKTMPKEDFPPGIIIKCNEKGWMKENLMLEWLDLVWRKRPGALFDPSGVLILDSMKAHLNDSVKETATKASVKAKLSVIPGGLTKILQPLDISVNKCFKSNVRKRWEDWMSNGLHTYTKSGKMRKASFSEVAHWVKESWDEIPKNTIVAGFKKAGILKGQCGDSSDDDENEDNVQNSKNLSEDLLELFNSDSDTSDFDGFE